jgi:protein involved in polysaccharide export with SLBB domain
MRYFVLGEVKSAGTFPLDKSLSVQEAVTLAGGFNDRAAPSGVKLIRRAANGEQEPCRSTSRARARGTGRWPCRRATPSTCRRAIPSSSSARSRSRGLSARPGHQYPRGHHDRRGLHRQGRAGTRAGDRKTPAGQTVLDVDMNDIIKRGQRDHAFRLQENDVVVVPESFF